MKIKLRKVLIFLLTNYPYKPHKNPSHNKQFSSLAGLYTTHVKSSNNVWTQAWVMTWLIHQQSCHLF